MARKPSVPQTDPTVKSHLEARGDAAQPPNLPDGDLFFGLAEPEGNTPVTPPAEPGRDPYDPAFLGLSQDFAAEASVAKKWDFIKVDKPSNSCVFRVHPTLFLKTMLLVLKQDNEVYLVHPDLRGALEDEPLCGYYTLFPYVSKAGTPFLWPVKMPGRDGKWHQSHQSAKAIAEKARERWARMVWNKDAGLYVAEYDQRLPEKQQPPAWPDMEFRDWLELAFRGSTIDSLDHPVLKHLHLED
jgi:hypothetical protein